MGQIVVGLVLVAVSVAAAALMSRRKPVYAVVRQGNVSISTASKSRGEWVLHRDQEKRFREDYLFFSKSGVPMETHGRRNHTLLRKRATIDALVAVGSC